MQKLTAVDQTSSNLVIDQLDQLPLTLRVHWNDGKRCNYHFLWLRDNCPTAFHPQTGERTFDQLSVSTDLHPTSLEYNDSELVITWSEGNHKSQFSLDWLYKHSYSQTTSIEKQSPYKSWDGDFISKIPEAEHQQLMSDDESLYRWMKDLNCDGLALVRKMPTTDDAVIDTAQRIDFLRRTNFGVTFNVISVPKPINLAYTSMELPLHTDLTNQEVPPGYQFLHCLANDSEGGASTFVDGLRVLEDLRREHPEHFRLLAENAIPFRFFDDSHDIREHHPVINLDSFGNIIEIKYNGSSGRYLRSSGDTHARLLLGLSKSNAEGSEIQIT